ncbi:MAG: tetratricopeptide repeat protein [bacterium]|nr:tetratricopeptide repeat protein [bacterium]
MYKKLYLSLIAILVISSFMNVEAKMTKEAHALYQQACAYEYKSDYNNAIKIIKQALDVNGEDAMLYTKIAGLYSDIGDYQNALSAYKKAVKLRPNDAFIYISIGNILQTTGDYENAYNAFNQAQIIYPEYKYNYLNLANIEYFRKNYKSATEYYNAFLGVYPEHMEANENLANVYMLTNQAEKACDIYSMLLSKYPSAFTEFEKYGNALFATEQYQPAAEMLEKAYLADNDNENITAKLALTYQNLGENEKAAQKFEETFKLNPELVALKFDYANLLGNMGKCSEAIEQYKEYLKAYPNDANAYRNLGFVYKKINNYDLALFNFKKSYSMDSSNVVTKKELALCYHIKKDYINALKYYDFALKSEPENIELIANKALTLHAMGNYVSAIDLYKTILEKQPNERIEQNLTSASIAYGYDLYDKKDYGQAILYFEDAIDLNDKEASAYFGYARANAKLGCTEEAISAYERAVMLAPGKIEYVKELNEYRKENKLVASPAKETPVATEEPVLSIIPPAVAVTETTQQKATASNTTSGDGYSELIKLGDEAYKAQKYDDAIDYYTKAVVYKPSDKNTMLKIANIYKLIGNNAKALSFYDKLLTIDARNTDAIFNKGLVFANQKKYEESIKCFEKVIELTPDYPYAYYSIGLAYEQLKQKDKALEYYYLYSGIESNEKMLNTVEQKIKILESMK